MTVLIVQESDANGLLGSGTSTGDVALYAVSYNGGSAMGSSTPTMDGTAVPTALKGPEENSPSGTSAAVYNVWWALRGVPAGTKQAGVTFTGTAPNQQTLRAYEVSGLPGSVAWATPSVGQGSTAGPADSGSITGTYLIVLGGSVGYALVITKPGTPWLPGGGDLGNSSFCASGYQIPSGSGTYDWQTPVNVSGNWAAVIGALVASGGLSGTGNAAISLAASAPGVPAKAGSGRGAITLAASAPGSSARAGSGSAAVSLHALASGVPHKAGTGTAVLSLSALATVPAPAGAPSTGSWWGLVSVIRHADQEFDAYRSMVPQACPIDGQPLKPPPNTPAGATTERYCPFCGWRYPRDYVAPVRTVRS